MNQKFLVVIPGAILFLGFLLLFVENLLDVIEKPEKNWSRAIAIGETQINDYPLVTKNNNSISLVGFFNDVLTKQTFDETFNPYESEIYEAVPFSKWTKFYLQEDNIYYFDFHSIFDGRTGENIAEADAFYSLKENIFFKQGESLFHIDPESGIVTSLGLIANNYDKIMPYQVEAGYAFLAYKQSGKKLSLHKFTFDQKQFKLIFQTTLPLNSNESIKEMTVTSFEDKDEIVVVSEIEGAGGKKPIQRVTFLSLSNSELIDANSDINFLDPKSNQKLGEISDISARYINKQLHLLFSANGESKTKYRSNKAFNIYEAIFDGEEVLIQRRSNTPNLSVKPQWIDDDTIIWLDRKGLVNPVYVSTNAPTLVDDLSINSYDLMQTLGKTIGMMSIALFTLVISIIWLIGPLVILIILYVANKKLIDNDPPWLYYIAITMYVISYFIFSDKFFTDILTNQAPNYLIFKGSTVYFSLIFGIIAHFASTFAARQTEWRALTTFLYFITVHVLLLMVFFGPYLL